MSVFSTEIIRTVKSDKCNASFNIDINNNLNPVGKYLIALIRLIINNLLGTECKRNWVII